MKRLTFLNGGTVYVEIRQRALRILHGEDTLVIRLEREPSGRLTAGCKENVSAGLRTLLKKKGWQPRAQAFCAIEARGVSLRRLTLPVSANTDLQRMLRLQMESEFPLPPEALAWGYSRIDAKPEQRSITSSFAGPTEDRPGLSAPAATARQRGESDREKEQQTAAGLANGRQDFMVVALKKEVLEEYAQMFGAAGVNPVFTVAALARSRGCPRTSGAYAVLDIGRRQSELISFKDGCADSLRVLAWGGDDITQAIEQGLGISREEAEKLKLQSDAGPAPDGEVGKQIDAAIGKSLESLASVLGATWSGQKLYLTGRGSRTRELPARLKELLPGAVDCERLETDASEGPTAAILGLKKAAETESAPPLILRLKESRTGEALPGSGLSPARLLALARAEFREILAQPVLRRWARLALLLCLCSIGFPYAQAFFLKPFVAKKLATVKAEKGRLSTIDRELTFLQYLKKSQPPYLDALTVVANSAPPGTRFDTVSMNRRGDLSLKGNMGNAQQMVDFRSKLIKSGFFSSVTVEEQTPSPDRQRMTVRLAAQWKPGLARGPVKAEPLPPGFVPGAGGMPFPGMGGGPVTFFPGPGMPGAMPPGPMPMMRGGPEGAMMRGPGGAPMGPNADRLRGPSGVVTSSTNAVTATNSADSAKSSAPNDLPTPP
jgi:Tfp pilus assembly PilM family ATPase